MTMHENKGTGCSGCRYRIRNIFCVFATFHLLKVCVYAAKEMKKRRINLVSYACHLCTRIQIILGFSL